MVKKKIIIFFLFSIVFVLNAYAEKSRIVEVEGTACMGDDKSRKDAEKASLYDAKRNAVENVKTFILSESKTENFQLVKDIISSISQANVEVIGILKKESYNDSHSGDCIRTKIKAIVTPDDKTKQSLDNRLTNQPFDVKVRTNREEYKEGEQIKIFIIGNKSFYCRIIYKGESGNTLQLLPNPFRKENSFKAGVEYEIPSKDDKFILEVSPPFGTEEITVFASSAELGNISVESAGGLYQVKESSKNIKNKTRDIKIQGISEDGGKVPISEEFIEETKIIRTMGK